MMRKRNFVKGVVPAVLLAFSLAACSSGTGSGGQAAEPAQEAQEAVEKPVEEEAVVTEAASEAVSEAVPAAEASVGSSVVEAESEEGVGDDLEVMDGEMVVPIPEEYEDLLIIDEAPEDGMLVSVSEKASVDAAMEQGSEYDGAGWLFGIGRISEEEGHELLCEDSSGRDIFARDEEGNYYVLYHPTDVRYVRASAEEMQRDQEQWSELCEWAGSTVPEQFIAQNPGLVAEKHSNTSLDIYLARIAYKGDVDYTISTLEYGPIEPPQDVDIAPFLDVFLKNVTFQYVDGEEAPDGEYVVLNIPEDGMRYDFFFMDGYQNYVREVWGEGDGEYSLYKAVFADDTLSATEVMEDWYHAIAGQGEAGEQSTGAE